MQVIWRDGMTKGDNAPMTVKAVETETGSRISADLVRLVDGTRTYAQAAEDEAAGLLEVIEAQMTAIDELSAKVGKLEDDQPSLQMVTEQHRDLQEWADQFPYLVEELCAALGFARNPVGSTGIPELDSIVSLAR